MPPRPTINSTDFTPSSASRPIVRYPHLTELNQQSRFITEEEAQNRNRWYRVNLSGPLKNFPSNLCHMTHITTLVIKNNNLERLPPELGNLKNLVNLDASYNRLRYLPETIGNLTDLKAIILNDNYLNDLPIEIGCCFNIRYMNLNSNPLSQTTMALYGDGSEAAIRAMLRQYLDIYARHINSTPPTRKWRSLCNPSKNGFRFKVMSYNVLSANYATMNQFPYCPSWAIDWEYRRRGILEELRRYSPHVICLQEIDTDQFETIFQPELAKNNYEGIFVVKTRAHTKDAVAARKVDGCAIFWDSTKFNKIATFKHEFGYSCSHLGINPSSLLIERVMIRDNVAIDVVLEVKNSGAANGKRFCVATGHIHWDPECSDVKLTQTILWTSELWQHLEKLCGSAAAAARMPVILCGDFNSLPQSGVVEFLSNGSIPINHAEFLDNGFKFNFQEWNILDKSTFENNTVHHHFNLDRAYKTSTDGMEYTNMTYDFKGMIDYVFFSRNAFRLLSSLDQIPDSWFASERVVGCPHIHIPSDHFSLLVELDLLANPNFGSGGGGRGLAISDPPDNTSGNIGEDSTSGNPTSSGGGGQNSSSPATNSPKPKGSAGNRQKQGKR
ncbi:unnamed protein product [Hymenolepis diminuta]|uniref:Endonuclease/exonuclease/phosphatase domain-containing protein n=1 Tax=Hymenolepis diminuta TaxID=6216 RepID=A0A564Y8Z0_HYMDI|nr:unnamed protein product [Hymenolepis diminuta]